MRDVGYYLQLEAFKWSGEKRDHFARASFNRYYYGIFLSTRTIVHSMNDEWHDLPHAQYPELLKGKIRRAINNRRRTAIKVGDWDLENKLRTAKIAVTELAGLIELAYATRVVADYFPETAVNFVDSSRFSLNGIDVTDAHGWHDKVEILTGVILSAWKNL